MALFSNQNVNSLNDEIAGVTAVTMERAVAVATTANIYAATA